MSHLRNSDVIHSPLYYKARQTFRAFHMSLPLANQSSPRPDRAAVFIVNRSAVALRTRVIPLRALGRNQDNAHAHKRDRCNHEPRAKGAHLYFTTGDIMLSSNCHLTLNCYLRYNLYHCFSLCPPQQPPGLASHLAKSWSVTQTCMNVIITLVVLYMHMPS